MYAHKPRKQTEKAEDAAQQTIKPLLANGCESVRTHKH